MLYTFYNTDGSLCFYFYISNFANFNNDPVTKVSKYKNKANAVDYHELDGPDVSEMEMANITYQIQLIIRKTYPCNEYPLKPHLYIVKLGYAGVYLFSLFLVQNIDCGYRYS